MIQGFSATFRPLRAIRCILTASAIKSYDTPSWGAYGSNHAKYSVLWVEKAIDDRQACPTPLVQMIFLTNVRITHEKVFVNVPTVDIREIGSEAPNAS